MNIINKRYLLVEENGFDDYSIRTFHTLEEAKITAENYGYKFTIIDLQILIYKMKILYDKEKELNNYENITRND